jgi:hypothetical protein
MQSEVKMRDTLGDPTSLQKEILQYKIYNIVEIVGFQPT